MHSKRPYDPPLKNHLLKRDEVVVLTRQAEQIFNQASNAGRSFKECLASVLLSGLIIGSQIQSLDEVKSSK